MENLIKKICDPLFERITSIISICSIIKVKDDTKTQTAQAEFAIDEVRENIERWQDYGMTSMPPKDSEGICIFLGGERRKGFIVATEDKDSRPLNLKEGEVCIYSNEKDYIHLKNQNSIEVNTKSFNIQSEKSIVANTEKIDFKTNKISIKNNSGELIDIISQLVDILSKTTTNTLMGAMPLNDAIKLMQLKTKIDSFKT